MSTALLFYLLKACAIQLCFIAIYLLVFKRSTFHSFNRYLLLLAIPFSFIIPLTSLSWGNQIPFESPLVSLTDAVFTDHINTTAEPVTVKNAVFSWLSWLLVLYGAGVLVVLYRCVRSTFIVRGILSNARRTSIHGFDVRSSSYPYAFTFFQTIHLPNGETDSSVLDHEKAHVIQKHWIDLIIAEVNVALLWFNPFAWLLRRELRLQHEFLADRFSIEQRVSIEQYLHALYTSVVQSTSTFPVHKFNSQSIKQRIIMITKKETPSRSKYLYALILVPVIALSFAFASKSKTSLPLSNRIIVIDPSHGGQDAGASVGNLSEKQLSLSVGLLIKEIAAQKGMNVVLTRTEDQSISLEDRVRLSNEAKADLFVSIHIGLDDDKTKSGIDCFINTHADSKKIGSVLIGSLKSVDDLKTRGIHASQAFVLKKNEVPAVILELGYLSNASDAKFLSDEANLRKLAGRIVDGLRELEN